MLLADEFQSRNSSTAFLRHFLRYVDVGNSAARFRSVSHYCSALDLRWLCFCGRGLNEGWILVAAVGVARVTCGMAGLRIYQPRSSEPTRYAMRAELLEGRWFQFFDVSLEFG